MWLQALLLLCLAACAQPQTDARPAEPVPADLTIGPSGAAGITRAVPFTIEALSRAAPGYSAAFVGDRVAGGPFTKVTLNLDGEAVFDLTPSEDGTHLAAIVTHSPRALGPRGESMGATFGAAPAREVMFCATPPNNAAYDFACSRNAEGNFWRGYRLPEPYEGPRAPFERINLDAAMQSTLVEMRWDAKR